MYHKILAYVVDTYLKMTALYENCTLPISVRRSEFPSLSHGDISSILRGDYYGLIF